jgi:hypothetical protein
MSASSTMMKAKPQRKNALVKYVLYIYYTNMHSVTTHPETKWQLCSITSKAPVNFMSDSDTRVENWSGEANES